MITNGNKKAIRKWVYALRSGMYQQCSGRNRNGNRYCAVGVGVVANGQEVRDMEVFSGGANYLSEKTGLPTAYNFTSEVDLLSISEMNDRGLSFLDIANILERAYLEESVPTKNEQKNTASV